jgi:hypothetical protein
MWGGLALAATLMRRLPLETTDASQRFGRWAVGLLA